MAGSDRSKWIGLCHRALQHLLLVEHWEAASEADLRGWQAEILAFRRQMAQAIKRGRGMPVKFEEVFSMAWAGARKRSSGWRRIHGGIDIPHRAMGNAPLSRLAQVARNHLAINRIRDLDWSVTTNQSKVRDVVQIIFGRVIGWSSAD